MKEKISPASIIILILTTAIGLWVKSLQGTVDDVIALKPQIIQIRKDVDKNYQWQNDWEREGELPADVRQSKDIEFLQEYVRDLKTRVQIVENAIGELKMKHK